MVIFVMNGALLEVIIEMGRRFLLFMVFATKVGGLWWLEVLFCSDFSFLILAFHIFSAI